MYRDHIHSIVNFSIFVLFIFIFGLRFSISGYAALSTPSNSDLAVADSEHNIFIEEGNDVSNQELYVVVAEIRDLLSVPGPATPSNSMDEAVEMADISVYEDAVPYSLSGLPDRNVVIYDGTFGGQSCKLVFPLSLQASLWIDDSGYLFNVGSGNLVGRLFYTDQFDSSDYEYNLFTLRSVLTNTTNDIYRYGFPSYRTRYYRSSSSSSLANDTTYGLFQVSDTKVYESDSLDFKIYCILLVIIFLIGGVWLCLWKRSSSS